MKNSEILSEEEIKFSDDVEALVNELAEGNTTVMLAYGSDDGQVIVRVRNIGGAVYNISMLRTLFLAINHAAEGYMEAVAEGRNPDEKDLMILSLYEAAKDVIEKVIMPIGDMIGSDDERTIH